MTSAVRRELTSEIGHVVGAGGPATRLPLLRTTLETLTVGLELDRGVIHHLAGSNMTRFQIGTRRYLVPTRPEAVDHVLHKNRLNYVKSVEYEPARVAAGINLLNDEGDSWAAHRGAVTPMFAKRHLNQLFDLMVDPIEDMVGKLVQQEGPIAFDMHPEMVRMTLRVVANSLFSQDFGPVVENMNELIFEAMDIAEVFLRLSMVGAMPAPMWTLLTRVLYSKLPTPPPFSRMRKIVRALDVAVNTVVDDRLANPTSDTDLLNLLIQADGGSWPRKRVRDEALVFMIAGHETTANALSWFWYLMAINPDARQRMLDEIDTVLAGRRVDLAALDKLPWTTACVMESQRLFSAVPLILRTALADDMIDGHRIRKGTTVIIPIHYIHHDERLWDNPEAFDPHRFMPGAPRPHRSSYLPFGGGRRVCVGQSFALMEMVAIAAAMSQRFVFDLAPEHRFEAAQSLTLRPKHGVKVIATHRASTPIRPVDGPLESAAEAQCPVRHQVQEAK